MYLKVIDVDLRPPNELVDTFSIDVEQIPVGEETRPQVFNGTFGFAYIEMSFKVECSVSHYFPNCDTSCVQEGNCICLPGYTGAKCEVEIDECVPINCSGNGNCVDKVNAFDCNCFPGHTGALCEVDIDECIESNVTCSDNGECIDEANAFKCNCFPGYTGFMCEIEIDECIGVDCSGNGECIDKVDAFECSCSSGHTGVMCELNNCIGVNCSGNGECMHKVDGFECNCLQGYSGEICEVNCMNCSDSSTEVGTSPGKCMYADILTLDIQCLFQTVTWKLV